MRDIGWRLTNDLILAESCGAAMTSLPPDLRVLIEDLATFLHDVHSAPDIPKMFESSPQQLLRRLDELDHNVAMNPLNHPWIVLGVERRSEIPNAARRHLRGAVCLIWLSMLLLALLVEPCC